jgi:tetratricopeptide (TPR) repeat protein
MLDWGDMYIFSLRHWVGLCMAAALALGASPAAVDTPEALKAAASCKEQPDASACSRAIRLGLSPKLASEAYMFWADSFPNRFGYTAEPEKLLRKALQLNPDNALAAYLLASYLPGTNYKLVEEKKKLLRRAAQLRPDWDAPHAQLATLAEPSLYDQMIPEWTKAGELAPDDPIYASKLNAAQEELAAGKLQLAQNEEKAKKDPRAWAIQAIYSAKFICNVAKAEEYAEKYNEFHRDGHQPPLVLADTYAACGQPEKARAFYREVIARYEKWMNSELTMQEAIQIQEAQLAFLDLGAEANRLHLILATLAERKKDWWRAKNELETLERVAPTADIYARHATALLQGKFPGYQSELDSVIAKGIALDPKFLENHPELKPYSKPRPKK